MPEQPAAFRPHGSPAPSRRAFDQRRGSSTERGYDRAWRKVRLAFLQAHPLCLFCQNEGQITPAEVVDHIKTIEDRPDLRLDETNLRSLCKSHHDSRTAREQGFARPGPR